MIADHFKYVDVNGVRTRYFEKGSGRPLVLIHGGAIGTGSSLDVFAENLEVLAESFRVIAPDKLAHGETDNPATDADYTIAAMTDHLLRFIQTLELDDINLIGQSRGAFNSTTLCLDHPNLIRGFVLCNSASMTPGVGALPEFSRKVRANAPFEEGSREWVQYRAEVMCFAAACVTEAWVDEWYRIFHLPKSTDARERMRTLNTEVFEPSVVADKERAIERIENGEYSTPTLIHWGREDPSAPLDPMGLRVFDLLASNYSEVSMHVTNRAGHFAFRERHDEFNRLAVSYFNALG